MLDASHARPVVLFKHSVMCSVSARAHARVVKRAEEGEAPLYVVVVQEAREASDAVAERLGVRHETPQALVLHGGRVTFHQSHTAIDPDRLREATQLSA